MIQRHYIVWKVISCIIADLNRCVYYSNALSWLQQRQFLLTLTLRLPANSLSPISNEWITAPCHLTETSRLLQNIFHKWRVSIAMPLVTSVRLNPMFTLQCYKYRKMFDQVSRNRMREKLTASIIFKNRKISYAIRYANDSNVERMNIHFIGILFTAFRILFSATTFVFDRMLNGRNYASRWMINT